MRRIEYKKGDKLGGCYYIHEASPYINPVTGVKIRKALFRCVCGNEFESVLNKVKTNHTKSCGCLSGGRFTHGLTQHPLFKKWVRIKARCYNPNVIDYKWYGGRGIVMYNQWVNDVKSFHDYVISLPNAMGDGLTLDRIDNEGNYEPGNLRWVNQSTQLINQGIKINNKSGIKGVYFDKPKKKWISQLSNKYIGQFKSKIEALWARNNFIIDNELFEYKLQKFNT